MSKPNTNQREKEFQQFIKENKGKSYSYKALEWFKKNLGEIVTAKELARITGMDEHPINHSLRRIFELRDEKGYDIINWKSTNKKFELKVNEWVLLSHEANPDNIRDRGVNKRIMFDVFERDKFCCQVCGRTPEDEDPFKPNHKIKLHVGHLKAHKQETGNISNVGKKLTKNDFMTMCNICNEGAKNKNISKITLLDRIKGLPEHSQKEVYMFLKNKFG